MNTNSRTNAAEQRKRPRVEAIEKAEAKGEAGDAQRASETEEKPTPEYGSQEYWEDRYKIKPNDQASSSEDGPDPYHAWYFKFEDLAPIILPLILGDDGNDDDRAEESVGNKNGDDDDDDDSGKNKITEKETACENEAFQPFDTSTPNRNKKNLASQQNDKNIEEIKGDDDEENKNADVDQIENENGEGGINTESGEESVDYELAEMYDDDEDSVTIRVGLAKNGPISVLEVGCGDAPLGRDLALSIQEHESMNGRDTSTIIRKVVCIDYSKNVIDTMKEEQQQELQSNNANEKRLPIHYEIADARKLSYQSESFEMILEKGTLDAMLSDSDGNGQKNCRMIVSECARVLTIGGYIIIISHLNARVDSGLQWLNDVIVPGLRAAGNYEWLVEVHGSDVDIPSDDEDDTEDNNKCIESPGPAVYFIEKVGITTPTNNSDGSEQSPPTIPLKFFSY